VAREALQGAAAGPGGSRPAPEGPQWLLYVPQAWRGQLEGLCLQFDHLALELPEIEGHSAPSMEERLRELERSWEARLGRKGT